MDTPAAPTPYICFSDDLGRNGCVCTAACRTNVATFRQTILRFTRDEPPPHAVQDRQDGLHAAAVFELDRYRDLDHVMDAARVVSQKRGRANREVERARRQGYYVKPFPFKLHVPDIVDIHRSREIRGGRPLSDDLRRQDVDALGGAPTAHISEDPPACSLHCTQHWGVFFREEGYRQGGAVTDECLVGYIGLIRTGDSAWYNAIMGHGDHLRHGIMYLLHYELVGRMLTERPSGLRYLVFYQFKRRDSDSATWWKILALFKPFYVICTDEYNLTVPATLPMPSVPEALVVLKQTAGLPRQDAIALCNLYGMDTAWLEFLRRLVQIEAVRAPGLLARVLSYDGYPALQALRPLASGLFPLECLEKVGRAVVLLQGKARGLDTLMPIFDAGVAVVTVFHSDENELQALHDTYSPDWQYLRGDDGGFASVAPLVAQSDILIAEMPSTRSTDYLRTAIGSLQARRLLLSVDEALLVILGCDTLGRDKVGQRLSWLLGAAYDCRRVSFRHGDPTPVYWVWLEARQ